MEMKYVGWVVVGVISVSMQVPVGDTRCERTCSYAVVSVIFVMIYCLVLVLVLAFQLFLVLVSF